jgi:DNA-directed RNA polymerase subunit beta
VWKDGKALDEVVYISGHGGKSKYTIAQANIALKDGMTVDESRAGINGDHNR